MRCSSRNRSWFACAVVLFALSGCDREQIELEPTPPPTVTISQPIEREISDEHLFTGHTEAIKSVEVRAQVSGYIDKVDFKDGDVVEENQVLFLIDPRPFDAAVDRDKAALAVAEARAKRAAADLVRADKLIKGKTITQEEYDRIIADDAEASATVKQAEANLKTSELNKKFSEVRAPVKGRTSRAMITKGNLVNGNAGSSTLLTTIVPEDPIYAYFDVDEPTYLRVAPKVRDPNHKRPPVDMQLANETGYPHRGEIDFIDNKIDPATGTIRGRGKFDNPNSVISPGLFVKVRIRSEEKRPALLVTDRAVGMDQGRKYVLVVGEDNKVEYREVQTGPLVDGLRPIESGLKPGEWVIVNGLQRARPGAPVEAQKTSMPLPPEAEEKPMVEETASVGERDA